MLIKFSSPMQYENFINNLRMKTCIMPKVFSDYKAGFYSKILKWFIVVMHANTNTWENVKWPTHLKFFGIKIVCKEKCYLLGIISDIVIMILPLIALFELFFMNDIENSFILIVGFSACLFLLRAERKKIKNFLYECL